MRLLILSQYFWPENFRVNDLVAEMKHRGHDVTVMTALPNYPEGRISPEFRRSPASFSHYEGAEVVRVPIVPRGTGTIQLVANYLSFVASASLLGPWKLRDKPFDAIFVFQPSPITSCIPAIVIGRMKGAPVLLWVLDLWPETLAAIGVIKSPFLLGLVGQLVRAIYRGCDLVLAQSRAFVDNIAKYAGGRSRIRYFPGWAEPLFTVSLDHVELAPEIVANRGPFNMLFAGNIGEAQDFPAILDAAERLKDRSDIRWLIVGDGRAAAWVATEIERRGLAQNVRLLGRHPLERMPAFFSGADALLVTLKRDPVFSMTIPGKVQTYLASGLPLVGMLDGEGARVIDESGAGFVVPAGDSAALAAAIEHMAGLSAADRRAMGDRGLAYCDKEFDRARLFTQLETWMSELSIARKAALRR